MNVPENKATQTDRLAEPGARSAEPETIELATESLARPRIPTTDDIAAYTALAQTVRGSRTASLERIRKVAEAGFDLRSRIAGDSNGGGAVAILTAREERARDAVTMLHRADEMLRKLYVESPGRIIECVVKDFEGRLAAQGVSLSSPYAAGVVAAALEQTRLMVVFAGRALKSEDHVFGTISGLKERSFAGEGRRDERPMTDGGERSVDDRRASFEARQAERAKRAAEKRQALKSGGAVPVERAVPVKRVDDEKAEVVAAAAAQQRGVFDAAKPTDSQRTILRQRELGEIGKMSGVAGGATADAAGVEHFRIELTNDIAALLKQWLAGETAFRGERAAHGGGIGDMPIDIAAAQERERECSREVEALRAVAVAIEEDLKRIGKAVLKAKDSPSVRAAFSPRMIAAFVELLEPPRSDETYELAD